MGLAKNAALVSYTHCSSRKPKTNRFCRGEGERGGAVMDQTSTGGNWAFTPRWLFIGCAAAGQGENLPSSSGLSHRPPERRGRCLPVRTCADLEDDVPRTSAPAGAACPTTTQALQFSDFPFVTLTAGGEPGSAPHPHWCTASGSDTACHTPTLPAGGAGRSWTLASDLAVPWRYI